MWHQWGALGTDTRNKTSLHLLHRNVLLCKSFFLCFSFLFSIFAGGFILRWYSLKIHTLERFFFTSSTSQQCLLILFRFTANTGNTLLKKLKEQAVCDKLNQSHDALQLCLISKKTNKTPVIVPSVRCLDKQHSLICTYSTSFHTRTKECTISNEISLWNSTWHNSSDYYYFILNQGCDLQNTACKQENIENEKLSTFCTDAVNASVCFMTKPVSLEDTTHVCFKQISQKKEAA